MPTALEEFTAEIGRHVFLREFSFAKNKFRAACGSEFELADHVLALPDETFVFQIKERNSNAASDSRAIEKWFTKKVLYDACGQLRKTERHLREQPSLLVVNQRGHSFDLAHRPGPLVKIILHSAAGASMPESVYSCRHKVSNRAGFVHVLSAEDFYQLFRCLAAPRELSAYFQFRQQFLSSSKHVALAESMIAAMFVTEASTPLPPDEAARALERTLADVSSFDLGPVLREYGEKVSYYQGSEGDLEYYKILTEFSRFNRADLRSIKKLFFWAQESAGGSNFHRLCRMLGSTKTGIVVFPVPAKSFSNRLNVLTYVTALAKYDWRLERVVGVSFARNVGAIEIDWCFISSVWKYDAKAEQLLKTNSPFRPTPEPTKVFRYPELLTRRR